MLHLPGIAPAPPTLSSMLSAFPLIALHLNLLSRPGGSSSPQTAEILNIYASNPVPWFFSSHFFPFAAAAAAAAFSFSIFLSFFPPLSISKCPALLAKLFSVISAKPAECFFLNCWLFCADAFLGLITRAPVCLRFVLVVRQYLRMSGAKEGQGRGILLRRRRFGFGLDRTLRHGLYLAVR